MIEVIFLARADIESSTYGQIGIEAETYKDGSVSISLNFDGKNIFLTEKEFAAVVEVYNNITGLLKNQ